MQCSQALCKVHLIHLSQKRVEKVSEEHSDARKSCVFKKIVVVCWGFPRVRASKFSSGVTQDKV